MSTKAAGKGVSKAPDVAHKVAGPKSAAVATLPALDGLEVDTLVLLIGEDERPLQGAAGLLDWRMCGWLTAQLQSGVIQGKRGEHVLTWPAGRLGVPRVLLMGAGRVADAVAQLPALLGEVAKVTAAARCSSVALAACVPAGTLEAALQQADSGLQQRVKLVLEGAPA